MSQLLFTKHAETVIRERGIRMEWIHRVIKSPELKHQDRKDTTLTHAVSRIPEYGDRALRVVYNQDREPIWVITAFFDRSVKDPKL